VTGNIARFLLSLHDGQLDFGLIGFSQVSHLPAIRWKLMNLQKLKKDNPGKHAQQREALRALLC